MTEKKDYGEYLKKSGLKNTRNRAAILSILDKAKQPLTAEDIYLKLRAVETDVNLSTVYRNLETMSEKNLVSRLSITGESRAFFEFNRMKHRHYLICIGCNKILPINHCPIKDYEKDLAKETDYVIEGHRLDVHGYCPKCRRNIDKGKE